MSLARTAVAVVVLTLLAAAVGGWSIGLATLHSGIAYAHRVWKRHPLGMDCRSGGEPGMPFISRRGPCNGGNDRSNPRLYGCRG